MGEPGSRARRAARDRARIELAESAHVALATLYCDESGNTGVHWADPEQPVFVHGGWLIPSTSHDALLDEVPRLRERYRLNAPELKWQQLARRDNGSSVFRDVFQTMIDHSAIPFFVAMDKDYLLAAKAVETFFDPAYNGALPLELAGAFDFKKDLAERLLQAPGVLSEFASMLRAGDEPDSASIERVALLLADVMTANGDLLLAEALRRITSDGYRQIGSEFGAEVWARTTLGHSMFALMERLEHFLRPRGTRVEIVQDDIPRMEDLLDIVRGMFRETDGSDIMVVNGEIRFFSMPTIDRLRLGDSKEEPFIQLADLLCGFVRTVLTKLKRSEPLDPDERAVGSSLAALFLEYRSWDANLPEETWSHLAALR